MGIWSKLKKSWHSFWMPYEVTYLGEYNLKELKEADNPADKLKEWQETVEKGYQDLLPRLMENERKKLLFERFMQFSDGQQKLLEQLAKQYSGMKAQRQQFKTKAFGAVKEESFDQDFPKLLKLIEDNELEFQKVQRDLSHLEGEKSALEYEFKRHQIGFVISGIILYFVAVLAVLGAVVLLVLSTDRDIFVAAIGLILSLGFFGVWSFVFRRYFRVGLEQNMRLQQRAVKLLNKIRLKYVRYRSLLDYEYQRFGISSSESLRLRYETVIKEKQQKIRSEDLEKQFRLVALDITRELSGLLPVREEDLIDLFLKDIHYYAGSAGRMKLKEYLATESQEIAIRLKDFQHQQEKLNKMRDLWNEV